LVQEGNDEEERNRTDSAKRIVRKKGKREKKENIFKTNKQKRSRNVAQAI
jgi:hypothetical protein